MQAGIDGRLTSVRNPLFWLALLVVACVFLTGVQWGLPSREVDAYLFGAEPVWPGAKIAALGLRVRRGCCYHGVALNVSMDLAPFSAIDPCGYPGLQVTQTSALGITAGSEELGEALASRIAELIERK